MFPWILSALPQIMSSRRSFIDDLPPRILKELLDQQSLASPQQLELATPPPKIEDNFQSIHEELLSIISILKRSTSTKDEYAQIGQVLEQVANIIKPKPGFDEVLSDEQLGAVLPDEQLGVVLPDEQLGVVLPDEQLGAVLPDEQLGAVLPDEQLGAVLPDEQLGAVLPDEQLGADLPDEQLGADLPDEQLGADLVSRRTLGGESFSALLGADGDPVLFPELFDNSKSLLNDMTGYLGTSIGATAGDLVKQSGSLLGTAATSIREGFAHAIGGQANGANGGQANGQPLNTHTSNRMLDVASIYREPGFNDKGVGGIYSGDGLDFIRSSGLLQGMIDALVQPWSSAGGLGSPLLFMPLFFSELARQRPASASGPLLGAPSEHATIEHNSIPAIGRRVQATEMNPRRNLQDGLLNVGDALKMLIPAVPTVPPGARNVVEAWNEAVRQLEEVFEALHIPRLDNYNWSLPETSTVGNNAVLKALNELLGQNLGASLGSYYGNVISGTSGYINNYINSARDAFLLNFVGAKHRRLLEDEMVLQETNRPSCAQIDILLGSKQSVSFNSVKSLRTCQTICQVYSSPLVFNTDCTAKVTLPCIAVSYNTNSGRCHLFFSIEETYSMAGYDTVDVLCSGDDTFFQTDSQLLQIQASGCSVPTKIQTISDVSKPILPTILPNAVPVFPEYLHQNAAADNIWRYNPDIPLRMTEVVKNVIYQVGYGVVDVEGETYWGATTGIADWRGCAYLCTINLRCEAWTYYFDSVTYASNKGGCSFASSLEPRAVLEYSETRTLSGPRMTGEFPRDLFGILPPITRGRPRLSHLVAPSSAKFAESTFLRLKPYIPSILSSRLLGSEEFDQALQELNPEVSCIEFGFVYFSLADRANAESVTLTHPTLDSIGALSAEMCERACRNASGCGAWQFVPSSILISNNILAASQRFSCLLLSEVKKKVASHPNIVTGIVTPSKRCEVKDMPISTPVITLQKLENSEFALERAQLLAERMSDANKETDRSADSESLTCRGYNIGATGRYMNGVGIRGDVLQTSSANVHRDVLSVADCHKLCLDTKACKAFTWGAWGGCYLLESVIAYVQDIPNHVISSLVNCSENPGGDGLEVGRRLDAGAASPRAIETCGRARRGLVYTEGSMIQNSTDYFSANECWLGCRMRKDCFYMTYLDGSRTDEKNSATWCLWFDATSANDTTRASLAYSGEPNCDVIGELQFENNWFKGLVNKKINLATFVAAATGSLIGLGMALVIGYFRSNGTTNEATFLSNLGDVIEEGDSDAHNSVDKQRNAFGMAESPPNGFSTEDFQEVEPKSTAKTRKRELFI